MHDRTLSRRHATAILLTLSDVNGWHTMPAMRIGLFTPTFLPTVGGTEFVTDRLAREFHSKEHFTLVLALGAPQALEVPYPVEWFSKPFLSRWFPERFGHALRHAHRRHPFDLFACNYAHPTGYAALRLGCRLQVPVVIVSHGGDLYRSSNDRRRPHVWRRTCHAYRHADGLIAISPYIEELIREIQPIPHRLECIPNGIDTEDIVQPAERPSDFTDARPFILCLGNLGPMKGFDDAIAAYALARDRLRPTTLVVVGDGKLARMLKDQAVAAGLGRDVLFMGQRTGNDKRWFLQHCMFGLMPSIEEGHPIVGLEFLAAGRPLICSLNRAFDGMYTEGRNAFRVPAKDVRALAAALLNMHSADIEAMGRESRRRASTYAWPAIADRYLAFFEEVVSGS